MAQGGGGLSYCLCFRMVSINIDSEHTIELSDSDNEIDCEVVNQINESTINITDEDTVENVSNMEYSNESDEDENSNSNNISSS